MDSRHFDVDPLSGAVETFYFDDVEGTFHIDRTIDVEPLIDMNRYLANDAPEGWKGDMHHVASIPDVVMMELSKKGIVTPAGRILDLPAFKRWLNDSDNKAFRTRPGRI